MTVAEANEFRALCDRAGIAVTHQRQVIYQVLRTMHGHPSPEDVYERVKARIPADLTGYGLQEHPSYSSRAESFTK